MALTNDAPDQNSVPPQNSTPPTGNAPTPSSPAPVPPTITSAGPADTPSSIPMASASAPPAPTAGQDLSDPNAHHAMIGKIFSAIAGGKPTGYVQTDKGPVPVKTDWAPGQLARHIVASAASLLAAGSGGMLAAKQHRPFELTPGTSLGEIRTADQDQAKLDAQTQFENKQKADEATLRANNNAMVQQEHIAKMKEYHNADVAWQQAQSMVPLKQGLEKQQIEAEGKMIPVETDAKIAKINQDMEDANVANAVARAKLLGVPGAKVMTDEDGKKISFPTGRELQEYVTANPDVIHGSSNGKEDQFTVMPSINPITKAHELIDMPADQFKQTIVNYGQAMDDEGNYQWNSDGSPVPNGKAIDPKTGKPTVVTGMVSPNQVGALYSADLNEANIRAQMLDRKEQAKRLEAEINDHPDLKQAWDAFNMGNLDKMTDKQRQLVTNVVEKEVQNAQMREKESSQNLAKLRSNLGLGEKDTPEIKEATDEYNQARADTDDASQRLASLTGNTPGIKFATAIINSGYLNKPWPEVDKAISTGTFTIVDPNNPNDATKARTVTLNLTDAEKEKAKSTAWNALSPGQRAAETARTNPQGAAAAPAAQQGGAQTPAAHKPLVKPLPPGYATIYDLQGNPHGVPADLKGKYLQQNQGWTE